MSSIKSKEDATYVVDGTELIASVNSAGTLGKGFSIDQVKDYMDDSNVVNLGETATEGGLVDCTSALEALVTLHGAHTFYYIPPGDWLFSGGLSKFTDDGIYIIGSPHAPRATRIHFEPTVTGVCFEWDLTQATGGIAGFWFTSTDTNYIKTAIKFTDGSNFHISHVHIGTSSFALTWGDATGASIGINGFGREVISIHTIRIFADKPMVFGVNPKHVELDIDQWHIYDTYLVVTDSLPNAQIEILDSVNVYQFTMDGYHAWAKGRYGLYWHNTTGTSKVSHGINISGIRCEQGYEGGGDAYVIYLDHTYNSMQQLSISQIYGDIARKRGIYIKGANDIKMSNIIITNNVGGNVPLEIVDNLNQTTKYLSWDNCIFGNFGGTNIIPDTLTLIESIPKTHSGSASDISAKYRVRNADTYSEPGVGVAESVPGASTGADLTKNYFARTLLAPQTDATGDLTMSASGKTITSASAMNFTGMLKDELINLDTVLNANKMFTLAADATASVITVMETVAEEPGVDGTVIHGIGLWHVGAISYTQKTNISVYLPAQIPAEQSHDIECVASSTGTSVSTVVDNGTTLCAVNDNDANVTPAPDIVSYTAVSQPARIWNNRATAPGVARIIVEQLNF